MAYFTDLAPFEKATGRSNLCPPSNSKHAPNLFLFWVHTHTHTHTQSSLPQAATALGTPPPRWDQPEFRTGMQRQKHAHWQGRPCSGYAKATRPPGFLDPSLHCSGRCRTNVFSLLMHLATTEHVRLGAGAGLSQSIDCEETRGGRPGASGGRIWLYAYAASPAAAPLQRATTAKDHDGRASKRQTWDDRDACRCRVQGGWNHPFGRVRCGAVQKAAPRLERRLLLKRIMFLFRLLMGGSPHWQRGRPQSTHQPGA